MKWKTNGIIIILVVVTFLLLVSLKSQQQSGDSLGYAIAIKTYQGLFHPHHLLYSPIVFLCYRFLSALGISNDIIFAGQIHNIFWAIITVICLFLTLRRLRSNIEFSLYSTLFLLVTQGFWELSTQNTVYMPSLGALALLVWFLINHGINQLTVHEQLCIALFFALSIFYHQLNVLFIIPLTAYLFITQKKQKNKIILTVLCFAGSIVMITYVLVFLLFTNDFKTFPTFIRFTLRYAVDPHPNWGTFAHISSMGLKKFLHSILGNLVAVNKYFENSAIIVLVMTYSGLFYWNIKQILRKAAYGYLRLFNLIWISIYLLFILWWLPEYRDLYLIPTYPFILLLFFTLNDVEDKLVVLLEPQQVKKYRRIFCLSLLFLFASHNFKTVFLPIHRYPSPAYQEALKLNTLASHDWIIVTEYPVRQSLYYYFERKTTDVLDVNVALLNLYQDIPISGKYIIQNKNDILISLSYLYPEHTIDGFNGYTHPRNWFKYLEWLFNFKYDNQTRLVQCRDFKIIVDDNGVPYLLILSNLLNVNGINDFFQILEYRINKQLGKKDSIFQIWFEKVYTNIQKS